MMGSSATFASLLCFFFHAGAAAAPPSFWSEFRGPNGSGVAIGCRPPTEVAPESATWSVKVPPGHSSPVVADDLVILTAVVDERLFTMALHRSDGSQAWRRAAPPAPLERVHEAGSPAASTPCVDEGRVFVYFGSFGLLCYDLNGDEQWRLPIPTPRSLYGMATSPIVHGEYVILVVDNDANLPDSRLSQSRILWIDKHSGELARETLRPFHRSGWSTPTVWTHEGGTELVVLGNGRLCGYDIETGIEKWYVNGFSRETISRPIAHDNRVYASASMLGGVADEQPDPEPFWTAILRFDTNGDERLQRDEMTGHFTFPLRPDLPVEHPGFGLPLPRDPARRSQRLDSMFAGTDRNGDGAWSKEEFLGSISFNRGKPHLLAVTPGGQGDITTSHVAWDLRRNIPEIPSPVLHGDRIFLVRDGGILAAVDASTGRVDAQLRLGAPGHYRSSPVIANDHLYVVSEAGVVSVVACETLEIVHQSDFDERVAATPAFDASTIYIRTADQLVAFRDEMER